MNSRPSYAGVGSRQTPSSILAVMTRFAQYMESRGYVLRSGGAEGADTAFELGASESAREIFLPWPNFGGRRSGFPNPSHAAMVMGSEFHPLLKSLGADWKATCEEKGVDFLKKVATLRKLMGRNVHQVLGPHLDSKSRFLICWTQDGADGTTIPTSSSTGGTGQAIRVAAHHGVRVYNLAVPKVLDDVLAKMDRGT